MSARVGRWKSILRLDWPAFELDANWLVIAGKVNDGDRTWQFRDPCLETSDLQRLSSWFDAIADGHAKTDEVDFTEPNLAFRQIPREEGRVTIRVSFELEARPHWRKEDEWGTVWLDFPVTADMLRIAARDLRVDLERFPERGPPLD